MDNDRVLPSIGPALTPWSAPSAADYEPMKTSIERADPAKSGRPYADWKLGFTRQNATNVEWMTQGELLTLWEQIGVLFNLMGMREGLSDEDLARMGIKR